MKRSRGKKIAERGHESRELCFVVFSIGGREVMLHDVENDPERNKQSLVKMQKRELLKRFP